VEVGEGSWHERQQLLQLQQHHQQEDQEHGQAARRDRERSRSSSRLDDRVLVGLFLSCLVEIDDESMVVEWMIGCE